MLCQICNKAQATVHLTEVAQNKLARDLHVCDDCARANGVGYKTSLQAQDAPAKGNPLGKLVKEAPEVTCPACGLAYSEFRQKVRAGCEKDYEVFREGIVPLLQKIHGATKHIGKVPPDAGDTLQRERRLRELEREMEDLVKREQYEKAARVRDDIRKLKEEKSG